ncbi:MAG: acetyl-CoA carboxylase carboxyltransferase subunit alpha [Verrucomicrobiota bacterium]
MDVEPLEFEKPIFEIQRQLDALRRQSSGHKNLEMEPEIQKMEEKLSQTRAEVYQNLTAWQRVQIARHPKRPFMLDYVERCFDNFLELHGDRHIGDDAAMPSGFAKIGNHKCVVTGHQKGRNTKENLHRNFGSAHPEGYRKSLRLMKMGEKFKNPIVSLIDTPGAFPGIGAEERNIAEAIAFNLREMAVLRTPIIAVVIGEGGSGGALGIGIADRVLMLENAYYSVISPEGCAAILWKDRKHAPEAAAALRLTASDLQELGIVDRVVPEPSGGAQYDHEEIASTLQGVLIEELDQLHQKPIDELLDTRYERLRSYGRLTEN